MKYTKYTKIHTLHDGISSHKNLLQLVQLHEFVDFLNCSPNAGHITSVTPDEVFSSEMNTKVWATNGCAQFYLAHKNQYMLKLK